MCQFVCIEFFFAVINVAVDRCSGVQPPSVTIHSDSREAILTLSPLTVHSRLVMECLLTLLSMPLSHFVIKLVWMPGHNTIAGNCKAAERQTY